MPWLILIFYVTWLIPMCDMTHSYVWHGYRHSFWQFISVKRLVFFLCHDSWLICICVMAHVSFSYMTWLMTYLHLWLDSLEQDIVPAGMSHIRMSHVSHIWMSHVSHMNKLCLTYEWVMSHVWMSHVPQSKMGYWQACGQHTNSTATLICRIHKMRIHT